MAGIEGRWGGTSPAPDPSLCACSQRTCPCEGECVAGQQADGGIRRCGEVVGGAVGVDGRGGSLRLSGLRQSTGVAIVLDLVKESWQELQWQAWPCGELLQLTGTQSRVVPPWPA